MPGRFAVRGPSPALRRGVAAMLALGVQGGLWLLLTPHRPARVDATAPPAVSMRLVAAAPQPAPAPRADVRPRLADRPARSMARAEPAQTPAAAEIAPPSPDVDVPPAAPRLNLALPGRNLVSKASPAMDLRTQVLNDPRANTVKPRVDERLALATGNAECLLAVQLPNGRVERRFGRTVYLETLHAAATGRKDLVALCVE
ncbi:MAG: hypothetical protein EKK53_27540 [Burkholderiales bacterium]|nr:MAG: hypothetical protein EKK53_27540 [Burkholderiales bacterium]